MVTNRNLVRWHCWVAFSVFIYDILYSKRSKKKTSYLKDILGISVVKKIKFFRIDFFLFFFC